MNTLHSFNSLFCYKIHVVRVGQGQAKPLWGSVWVRLCAVMILVLALVSS